MATKTRSAPRTYGNWRRPRTPGLLKLNLISTILLFTAVILAMIVSLLANVLAAVITLVPFACAIGLLSWTDRNGITCGQALATRLLWWRARRHGGQAYRSGPVGKVPTGRTQLPGIAAKSELTSHADAFGRPFGLICVPQTGHVSVALVTYPDGAALVDETQVDQWVAGWGGWLAQLGQDPHLVAAAVTIDSAPATGVKLRRNVLSRVHAEAHPIAAAMLAETVEKFPIGAPETRAWITLTWRQKGRSLDDAAADIAARLPGLIHDLGGTGAGAAHAATAFEMCRQVRCAFDPAVSAVFDEAEAAGEQPDLSWTDSGPVAAQENWASYRHDGHISRSWIMSQAPRGLSLATCLSQLVGPHPDIARKRVTLLYRPETPAAAAAIVESDKRDADFAANSQPNSARAKLAAKAAEATAQEEAQGAGLVNFGLLVTATAENVENLPLLDAAVKNLSAGARIVLRPAYACQAAAFSAGLPIGIVLNSHIKVPAALAKAL